MVGELSRQPQGISKDAWYYEEHGGLLFIVYPNCAHNGREAIQFTVPWRKVRASLKRKDAPRRNGCANSLAESALRFAQKNGFQCPTAKTEEERKKGKTAMKQLYLGQDVLYIPPTSKEECAAKVVRILDRTKHIVNLLIFTDDADRNNVVRNVQFDEADTKAPNTWHWPEHTEQARAAGR